MGVRTARGTKAGIAGVVLLSVAAILLTLAQSPNERVGSAEDRGRIGLDLLMTEPLLVDPLPGYHGDDVRLAVSCDTSDGDASFGTSRVYVARDATVARLLDQPFRHGAGIKEAINRRAVREGWRAVESDLPTVITFDKVRKDLRLRASFSIRRKGVLVAFASVLNVNPCDLDLPHLDTEDTDLAE